MRCGMTHCTLATALCLAAPLLLAQEVGLAGIMGNKALLMLNGQPPRAVPVGAVLEGVRVVAVQGDQVLVEIDGKKRPLRVGQHAVGRSEASAEQILLTADQQGHFYTNGTVNGRTQRFLVDTGATMIFLGANDARRLGLNFEQGQKGWTQTANGQVVTSKVQLDTVRIGGVTLHQVDAVIHQTDMPIALLGMSFLSRMEIRQDGQTMTMKKRF